MGVITKRLPRLIAGGAALALIATVGLFITPAAAAEEEDVTVDHDADWHVRDFNCSGSNTGDHTFLPGPAGIPGEEDDDTPEDEDTPGDSITGGPPGSGDTESSTGSLRLRTGSNGESLMELRNTRYAGRLLSEIVEITYWTYNQSVTLPDTGEDVIPAIYFGLDLDTNSDNVADETLLFEPGRQQFDEAGDQQHEVTPGTWQKWIAKDANTSGNEGRWYARDDMVAGNPVHRSLEQWALALPSATKIVNRTDLEGLQDEDHMGGVFLAAGCLNDEQWDDFTGFTDAASLTFTTLALNAYNSVLYDMEPPTPTGADRLDCLPEEEVRPTGKTHEITCTARNGENTRVADIDIDAEAIGANDPDNSDTPQTADFGCTTRPEDPTTTASELGSCTIRHGTSGAGARGTTRLSGITTYVVWIDHDQESGTVEADRAEAPNESIDDGGRPEPDDTDVVEVRWVPLLDCEPDTVNLTPGSSHTITCTVRDAAGTLISGMNVDIEISGPNDTETPTSNSFATPDLTCTTGSTGTCSVVHGPGGRGTTTSSGRTTYRAWNDYDGLDGSFTFDTSEGRSETGAPGATSEPDFTDVFEVNWTSTGSSTTPPPSSPPPSNTPSNTPSATPCPTPSPSPSGASPSPSGSPCPSPTPRRTTSPSPSPSPSPSGEPPRHCGDGTGNAIAGTSGNDVLIGTSGDDTICGFGGNDTIRGRGGDDLLLGGGGDDLLEGGRGNDVLKGGAGNDVLGGGAGNDGLSGGPGNDGLEGDGGNDRLGGGKGRDQLYGGRERDRCDGGPGRDRLRNCE